MAAAATDSSNDSDFETSSSSESESDAEVEIGISRVQKCRSCKCVRTCYSIHAPSARFACASCLCSELASSCFNYANKWWSTAGCNWYDWAFAIADGKKVVLRKATLAELVSIDLDKLESGRDYGVACIDRSRGPSSDQTPIAVLTEQQRASLVSVNQLMMIGKYPVKPVQLVGALMCFNGPAADITQSDTKYTAFEKQLKAYVSIGSCEWVYTNACTTQLSKPLPLTHSLYVKEKATEKEMDDARAVFHAAQMKHFEARRAADEFNSQREDAAFRLKWFGEPLLALRPKQPKTVGAAAAAAGAGNTAAVKRKPAALAESAQRAKRNHKSK